MTDFAPEIYYLWTKTQVLPLILRKQHYNFYPPLQCKQWHEKTHLTKHLPARSKGKTKLATFVNSGIKGPCTLLENGYFYWDCVAKNHHMLENDT